MLRGKAGLFGHVTKHPPIIQFPPVRTSAMFESNVNSGTVWEVRLVKQSWNLPFWGRLPPFRCLWLEKEWFLLQVDSFVLESRRDWVVATWTSERGGKISRFTSEILGMSYTLKGFWWVKWCFIWLSYCQTTQGLSRSVLLGWHPVVGVWLWLSSPQTKQERRKLLTEM